METTLPTGFVFFLSNINKGVNGNTHKGEIDIENGIFLTMGSVFVLRPIGGWGDYLNMCIDPEGL